MSILDLIFPKKCLECGFAGRYVCENCSEKVPSGGWTNREIYSIWKYEGVIRKAIITLKYKYSTEIAKELAEVCVKKLKVNYLLPGNYCLVPIPLHWHRKNFRGFNQSEEIGRLVAEKMDWEFIPDLLIRRKHTKAQVELKGGERRKNLQGVFALNPKYQPLTISHNPYIIFDDVFTTGSTIKEAAKVLKNEGFKKIWGLTIAR